MTSHTRHASQALWRRVAEHLPPGFIAPTLAHLELVSDDALAGLAREFGRAQGYLADDPTDGRRPGAEPGPERRCAPAQG